MLKKVEARMNETQKSKVIAAKKVRIKRDAIFEPVGDTDLSLAETVSFVNSLRSSTVMRNVSELSSEKVKAGHGAISPKKRMLIRSILDN